jgi:hypothetical protein
MYGFDHDGSIFESRISSPTIWGTIFEIKNRDSRLPDQVAIFYTKYWSRIKHVHACMILHKINRPPHQRTLRPWCRTPYIYTVHLVHALLELHGPGKWPHWCYYYGLVETNINEFYSTISKLYKWRATKKYACIRHKVRTKCKTIWYYKSASMF